MEAVPALENETPSVPLFRKKKLRFPREAKRWLV